MTYTGFTPGLNFGSAFAPGKVPITSLKYGSPIGGMTNNSFGLPSFEGMDTDTKNFAMLRLALKPDPTDYAGLTGFMKEQAGIARDIAKDKFKDETNFGMVNKGIDALTGGLQAYLGRGIGDPRSQVRAGKAYTDNSLSRPIPTVVQQAAPQYVPYNYFS